MSDKQKIYTPMQPHDVYIKIIQEKKSIFDSKPVDTNSGFVKYVGTEVDKNLVGKVVSFMDGFLAKKIMDTRVIFDEPLLVIQQTDIVRIHNH
jgi:hypothetical protein